MSSEHQRIERIRHIFARPDEAVVLGIGDDAAVLEAHAQRTVWTVDAAVQDVHFSLDFMSLREAGYRALMAAVSDVAAMGGCATAALCALNLPRSVSDAELDLLLLGLADAADRLAMPIVGGNLSSGRELCITTSVLGRCGQRPLRRDGARPGDGIYVTGPLGGAALGLAALRAGELRDGPHGDAVRCFLAPLARLDVAQQVAQVASAGMDISDGLAQDLSHLCKASGVGATIDSAKLPALPNFAQLAQALGQDPQALALAGGEDYELLFTAPLHQVPSTLGTLIGTVSAGSELTLVGAPSGLAGFDHFR